MHKPEGATRSDHVGSRSSAVDRYLASRVPEMTAQLASWVSIPSIAGDPDRKGDMMRSARWIAGEMREVGFSTQLIPTPEGITVIGELRVHPDRPTVLVYSHHDVRIAKAEMWEETDPFTARERDGRLYGRGASDAKGQVIAHLWGLRAHLASSPDGDPAVNLVYLIDGSEECGSLGIAELVEEHRRTLACDVVVFSDTLQWTADLPAVVTSMRGTITASLTVRGPRRDVHSGVVSGVAPNPVHVLAEVVSAMHDREGRVAVPGFYDQVAPLSEARRRELADLPHTDEEWVRRTETRAVAGEEGYSVPERLFTRPALEVISVAAGDIGSVTRSVIPATASADISVRTVLHQDMHAVAEALRAFVADRIPATVEYELTVAEELSQPAYETSEGPALQALERAIARAHGTTTVVRMGNAGGGPVDVLRRILETEILFFGTGLPEDRWHANDESIDLDVLRRGAATVAHLWDELGACDRSALRPLPR